jgi:mono/diheme cytochrome c family protein
MMLRFVFICGVAGLLLAGGTLWAADGDATNVVAATPAVFVPDTSHQNEPLPDGFLAWDGLMKEITVAAADAGKARVVFNFTNVSSGNVVILDVHPSCGCTTAQLPPMPWMVLPGTNSPITFTINVAGRIGTLFKTAKVTTDKGYKQLMFKITVQPPVLPTQTEAERARALEIAKGDRQAVFRGDCATCHVKPGEGKYGKSLYDAVCGICHESKTRASMVPDLRQIKTATNLDYWQTWIAHGKAGSLMPAFSTPDGGPLSDMQIATLVQYLTATFPSQVPEKQ